MFLRNHTKHEQTGEAGDMLIGYTAFSADGEPLGSVAEVRADSMRMDVAMKPDYWLETARIASIGEGRITMDFAYRELAQQMRARAAEGATPEGGRSAEGFEETEDVPELPKNVILSEEEQMEQRIRMEAELAEQRKSLPDQGEGMPGGTVGEPVEEELSRLEQSYGRIESDEQSSPTGAVVTPTGSEPWQPDAGDGGDTGGGPSLPERPDTMMPESPHIETGGAPGVSPFETGRAAVGPMYAGAEGGATGPREAASFGDDGYAASGGYVPPLPTYSDVTGMKAAGTPRSSRRRVMIGATLAGALAFGTALALIRRRARSD